MTYGQKRDLHAKIAEFIIEYQYKRNTTNQAYNDVCSKINTYKYYN